MADLAVELRAWPAETWAGLGVDPTAVARMVLACWRDGELAGVEVDGATLEEARSLERPAMAYARGQLRARLARQVRRAHRRWLHPSSQRRPGDTFL